MKPTLALPVLCLLAGLLAWWWFHKNSAHLPSQSPAPHATAAAAEPAPAPAAHALPKALDNAASATPAQGSQTGPRYKRAYMLSIDKGALALVEAQDIEGDFAQRRGKEEEWSNMLRFRLMSETNAVLAEELLPAPDQVCHVLDPRSADGKAVNLTSPGPVIFQVRLPRVKGASRLDIFRILQPGEPVVENLLGSLALPH